MRGGCYAQTFRVDVSATETVTDDVGGVDMHV
jgi:hypothetical protein